MPDAITTAAVQQYKANVELLLQQEGSLLRDKVMTSSLVGKAASVVEQFGSATAQLKVSRHADTPLLDLAQDKRWVFPLDYEWASLIDHEHDASRARAHGVDGHEYLTGRLFRDRIDGPHQQHRLPFQGGMLGGSPDVPHDLCYIHAILGFPGKIHWIFPGNSAKFERHGLLF